MTAFLDAAPRMVAFFEKNTRTPVRGGTKIPDTYSSAPGAGTGGRSVIAAPYDARGLVPSAAPAYWSTTRWPGHGGSTGHRALHPFATSAKALIHSGHFAEANCRNASWGRPHSNAPIIKIDYPLPTGRVGGLNYPRCWAPCRSLAGRSVGDASPARLGALCGNCTTRHAGRSRRGRCTSRNSAARRRWFGPSIRFTASR